MTRTHEHGQSANSCTPASPRQPLGKVTAPARHPAATATAVSSVWLSPPPEPNAVAVAAASTGGAADAAAAAAAAAAGASVAEEVLVRAREDDNPTIGLILCSEKNEAIAKYSVLADGKQIFASKYRLVLPTEEELVAGLRSLEAKLENPEERGLS